MGVYSRSTLAFERGEGVRLWATDGTEYLDCVAGIAVNGLGHANPILVKALTDQAQKLWHVSNIYRIPEQEVLADRLCAETFADAVFFTNSGTEAVELALKLARKYHAANGKPERIDIITFEGAFHGRSYAAVNAGGNDAYLAGFGPRLPGYVHLPFGDMDALKAAIGPTTAAIFLEPVQGEGGARSWPDADLREIRKLCDETGTLLMFDEIQCGMGRTGKLFAYDWLNFAPAILTVAKGIGGGFPLGAVLATESAADGMTVGTHGTTYGGNQLAMAVGNAAVTKLTEPGLLDHVNKLADYLRQQLGALVSGHPNVFEEVRGSGLMIGLKTKLPSGDFIAQARANGLVVLPAGDNVVRLLPPLTLSEDEAREGITLLNKTASDLEAQKAAAQ